MYPFSLEAGLGRDGVYLGTNHLSGGETFHFDLFTAYRNGLIQGPNAVISGAGAHGKSALAKAYVHRSAALYGGRRFTAVIDPKGEWTTLARALGWSVLQLRPHGSTRLNPLDVTSHANPAGPWPLPPGVAGPSTNGSPTSAVIAGPDIAGSDPAKFDSVITQRAATAATLLAIVLGRPELDATQLRIITVAMRHLSHARPRTNHTSPVDVTAAGGPGTPTLRDLLAVLADPPAGMAEALNTTHTDLLSARRLLLDACAILVEHDLAGMCDGPTTTGIDWTTTPGLVLDLSALLTHRRALRLVLTAVYGWLSSLMYARPDRHKLNIIDEAWIALDDLAIVRYLQDHWRLGRQWGTANLLITHAIADLQSQTADGSAQSKIAAGLLNTTSVRIFLHQQPEHTHHLADLGLQLTETALLAHLAPFQALWKIGAHTALIDHHFGAHEWPLFNTDTAMSGL